MTDSLFEAVAHATRELTKYGFSTQEFAMLVQQHNMTDTEALAVAKVFDYLLEKRERSTVDFLLRTSRLPLKVPKTFDNFPRPLTTLISAESPERMLTSSVASPRCLPSMLTKTLPLLDGLVRARPIWPRLLGVPAVSMDLGVTSLR